MLDSNLLAQKTTVYTRKNSNLIGGEPGKKKKSREQLFCKDG